MNDSSDFFDPFSYVPLKRRKRPSGKSSQKENSTPPKKSQNLNTQKRSVPSKKHYGAKSQAASKSTKPPAKSSKTPPKSAKTPTKTPKKTSKLTQTPSPGKQLTMDLFKDKATSGVCPLCQMPLELLADTVAPDSHIASCAEITRTGARDCPQGVECRSISRHHYIQFDHAELARHRDLGFLDLPTEIVESRGLDFTEVEGQASGQPPAEAPQMSLCTPFRRNTPARLNRTDGEEEMSVHPPKDFSTPARPRKVISPIQRRKRLSDRSTVTEVIPSSSIADGHRGGKSQTKLNSEHVNRFLDDIEQHAQEEPQQQQSASLLRNVPNMRKDRPAGNDNPFSDDEEHDDPEFDAELDDMINTACDRAESAETISGHSQMAGPSGTAKNQPNPRPRPSFPPCTGAGDTAAHHSRERRPRVGSTGSSNLRYSETEKLCTDSPFQIRAVKDSEELELSMDLNSAVKCNKLRVRVPLKGDKVPIEVTARYSDSNSPSKQAKITSYFNLNKNSSGESFHSVTESGNRDGEYITVKKAKLESAVNAWNKLLTGKPLAPTKTVSSYRKVPDSSGDGTTNLNGRQTNNGELKRKVPFYKKISGTSFTVDAFNYGHIPLTRYSFLSHYHYDHYQGLSRHWNTPIVASSLTKRMVTKFLKVQERLITTLDPGESRVFDGVEVTSVDANHCPGSVMFVFRLTTGDTILHVGDFRACPEMESDPVFWNNKYINTVYLDTTYCRPEYDFPPQQDVIDHTIQQVENVMEQYDNVAVLVGAYTIGKERIFKGIAAHLDCKVWANPNRLRTWQALEDAEINARITKDRRQATVHVIEQKKLNWAGLEQQFKEIRGSFKHILGVKPTGWTHSTGLDPDSSLSSIRVKTRNNISFLEVPYSEHSSYSELKRFIQFLRIKSTKQIIPTVNLRDRGRMNGSFEEWIREGAKKGPESQ